MTAILGTLAHTPRTFRTDSSLPDQLLSSLMSKIMAGDLIPVNLLDGSNGVLAGHPITISHT